MILFKKTIFRAQKTNKHAETMATEVKSSNALWSNFSSEWHNTVDDDTEAQLQQNDDVISDVNSISGSDNSSEHNDDQQVPEEFEGINAASNDSNVVHHFHYHYHMREKKKKKELLDNTNQQDLQQEDLPHQQEVEQEPKKKKKKREDFKQSFKERLERKKIVYTENENLDQAEKQALETLVSVSQDVPAILSPVDTFGKNFLPSARNEHSPNVSLQLDEAPVQQKKEEPEEMSRVITMYKDVIDDHVRKRRLLELELLEHVNGKKPSEIRLDENPPKNDMLKSRPVSAAVPKRLTPRVSQAAAALPALKQASPRPEMTVAPPEEKHLGHAHAMEASITATSNELDETHLVDQAPHFLWRDQIDKKPRTASSAIKPSRARLKTPGLLEQVPSRNEHARYQDKIQHLERQVGFLSGSLKQKEETWKVEKDQLLNEIANFQAVRDHFEKKNKFADQFKQICDQREKKYKDDLQSLETRVAQLHGIILASEQRQFDAPSPPITTQQQQLQQQEAAADALLNHVALPPTETVSTHPLIHLPVAPQKDETPLDCAENEMISLLFDNSDNYIPIKEIRGHIKNMIVQRNKFKDRCISLEKRLREAEREIKDLRSIQYNFSRKAEQQKAQVMDHLNTIIRQLKHSLSAKEKQNLLLGMEKDDMKRKMDANLIEVNRLALEKEDMVETIEMYKVQLLAAQHALSKQGTVLLLEASTIPGNHRNLMTKRKATLRTSDALVPPNIIPTKRAETAKPLSPSRNTAVRTKQQPQLLQQQSTTRPSTSMSSPEPKLAVQTVNIQASQQQLVLEKQNYFTQLQHNFKQAEKQTTPKIITLKSSLKKAKLKSQLYKQIMSQ